MVTPLSRRRFVTIRTMLPARAIARIDSDECIHALTNLIENAIKHGRIDGTVAVLCDASSDEVTITVDDDGDGVAFARREVACSDEKSWSALFEAGVRGATQSEGHGIGLAIVRAIANRADGHVAIASSPLGGARFTLRLPAG